MLQEAQQQASASALLGQQVGLKGMCRRWLPLAMCSDCARDLPMTVCGCDLSSYSGNSAASNHTDFESSETKRFPLVSPATGSTRRLPAHRAGRAAAGQPVTAGPCAAAPAALQRRPGQCGGAAGGAGPGRQRRHAGRRGCRLAGGRECRQRLECGTRMAVQERWPGLDCFTRQTLILPLLPSLSSAQTTPANFPHAMPCRPLPPARP